MNLVKKVAQFRTNEPYVAGEGQSSVVFLKLIPKEKKEVLVIGCGEGHEVAWLNQHGFLAEGLTNNALEARNGKKKFGVRIHTGDMHDFKINKKYDAIFASNVLEHSVAPFLALLHWRDLLKTNGWIVIVMPSKEWLSEYYHFSVLTHSQTKDLLHKAGFELLAGPEMKSKMPLNGGDIFYDLGRQWGHHDGYVATKKSLPDEKFTRDKIIVTPPKRNSINRLVRSIVKYPYNKLRVWRARTHRE